MKVIGITGPTGAGKTTALRALKELEAECLDADQLYHKLLAENTAMQDKLVKSFGKEILNPEGEIERARLAQVVYPDRLEELNAVTHPFVITEVDKAIQCCKENNCKVVAIDAIALVESGLGVRCDLVVAVLAPLELRIRRIMARDGIDESYARRRALAQKGEQYFREHSDYVLENSETETQQAFQQRAEVLFQSLLR